MRSRVLFLLSALICLPLPASAQTGWLGSAGGDLPLLGCISAGIIAGGVISAMRTRHQK